MAGSTGLEPATSGLTVQCANQAAPRAHATPKRSNYTTAGAVTPATGVTCSLRAEELDAHVHHERFVLAADLAIRVGERRERATQRRVFRVERLFLDLEGALEHRNGVGLAILGRV